MSRYSLSHLSDVALVHDLKALLVRERGATAEVIAHIAEVDGRRLYAPAGYDSMYSYCLGELHLSEDAAAKRIHVARVARRFPDLLPMIVDGRLHLSGASLLAPHLTADNADGLLAAATHHTKAEIERFLAERFPKPDLPASIVQLAPATQHAPGHVEPATGQPGPGDAEHAPGHVESTPGQIVAGAGRSAAEHAPGHVESPATPLPALAHARIAPLAPERFGLQCTVSGATHEKLRYAQALLGHAVPNGELAEVLDRALDALIAQLEKRKFAVTASPRPGRGHTSRDPRHVPAVVRRAVLERDEGRCTFVGEGGRRCESRTRLEFDHVQPVAKGGESTVANLRLRCRAHNQHAAERAFGPELMDRKRAAARRRWERLEARRAERERRERVAARARAAALTQVAAQAQARLATAAPGTAPRQDFAAWLPGSVRRLGSSG